MRSRIQSLGSGLIVLALLLFAGSAGAQDVSARCEAAMDRAAGHYSQCLLRADASHARHENRTKLESRQARCETRFDRRTSRAINRHGADECPSSDLVAAMGDRALSCAADLSTEAGGTSAASLLYVQNADGGSLTETKLVLAGIDRYTGWFTDRPERKAGRTPTEDFVSTWGDGENSFADDSPNADFSCEVEGQVVNYVVTLSEPLLDGGDLSYTVDIIGDALPAGTVACDGESHLFIDSGDCPGSKKSVCYGPFEGGAKCSDGAIGSVCCADGDCTGGNPCQWNVCCPEGRDVSNGGAGNPTCCATGEVTVGSGYYSSCSTGQKGQPCFWDSDCKYGDGEAKCSFSSLQAGDSAGSCCAVGEFVACWGSFQSNGQCTTGGPGAACCADSDCGYGNGGSCVNSKCCGEGEKSVCYGAGQPIACSDGTTGAACCADSDCRSGTCYVSNECAPYDGCTSESKPYSSPTSEPRWHCSDSDPHEYFAEYENFDDPCNSCSIMCKGNCELEE